MKEEACLFGPGRSLVGVITDPASPQGTNLLPGVIVLNSGIVHRVGLNRLHVNLARKLAEQGFITMRFDFSGIGDSLARQDDVPFRESSLSETQQAMNYLAAARGINRFVILGICSGAGIALRAACMDPRVVGVVPVNSRGYLGGRNGDTISRFRNRALLRHYWRIAFCSSFRRKNWLKAVTGKVNYRMFTRAAASSLLSFLARKEKPGVAAASGSFVSDVGALVERGVRLLFIHAEGDEGLDFVQMALGREIRRWRDAKGFRFEVMEGANHTFTMLWSQKRLLQMICEWAAEFDNTRRGAAHFTGDACSSGLFPPVVRGN